MSMFSALAIATSITAVNASSVSNSNRIRTAGSTNEAGLLGNFSRLGFTPTKGLSELIANSFDAQSPLVIFKENRINIKQIDFGLGLDYDGFDKMFDLFRQNHEGQITVGVSGLGGKEGTFILSKKEDGTPTQVIVFSKTKDGEYLKAIVPWNEIMRLKIWSNQIQIVPMTEEEIADFNNDREGGPFQHGTTIQWEFSQKFMDLLI